MITHKGQEVIGDELIEARKHVADDIVTVAYAIYKQDVYADHVTPKKKTELLHRDISYAEEVQKGLHDDNFTIWQRMNTFITGECVALLK